MKKFTLIIALIFLSLFVLTGCSTVDLEVSDMINSPQNNYLPIKGTWIIESGRMLSNSSPANSISSVLNGKTATFDETKAVLGDQSIAAPEYKIKKVDTKDYFLYTYKINSLDLGITNTNVDVISITSEDKLFYDFIKIDDSKLIAYVNQVFYTLTKVNGDIKAPEATAQSVQNKAVTFKNSKESPFLRSGILLGLRSASGNNSSYRTLWIASNNMELNPVLETQNLFVPRMNGFWKVSSVRNMLYAEPLEASNKTNSISFTASNQVAVPRNILFVSNDYIATEYGARMDHLQVIPIDGLQKGEGVKISDVAGEKGKLALINSARTAVLTNDKDVVDRLDTSLNEESFTLIRRNAHWIMRGRLNEKSPSDSGIYLDFNINILPPSKMLYYDSLYVSWASVKSKHPDAVDAYTSPNKDLALILTKNILYVYSLANGEFSERPLRRIKLKEGENVVMAEWATGDYVEKWENTFMSLPHTVVQ